LQLVHLFYPHIEVKGIENLPTQGPIIFVLNHPNGLLDPMLLIVGLQRPVSFLAKSTFFANPVGHVL
jgi:1-acyl-sn-glycerol-3-phosphate acyltransferase